MSAPAWRRGGVTRPLVEPRPLHEVAPRHRRLVATFPHAGNHSLVLQPAVGWLHSLIIKTSGSVKHVRLRECNGAPIVDASPRALQIAGAHQGPDLADELRIPLALYGDATGALADTSCAHPYRLDITDATEAGEVYADYWPLPSPMDGFGRPQRQHPPQPGLRTCLSEFIARRDHHGDFPIARVGNTIVYLALILDEQAFSARLSCDFFTLADIRRPVGVIELIDAKDRSGWLPTTQATRLALECVKPAIESARFVMREVWMDYAAP